MRERQEVTYRFVLAPPRAGKLARCPQGGETENPQRQKPEACASGFWFGDEDFSMQDQEQRFGEEITFP